MITKAWYYHTCRYYWTIGEIDIESLAKRKSTWTSKDGWTELNTKPIWYSLNSTLDSSFHSAQYTQASYNPYGNGAATNRQHGTVECTDSPTICIPDTSCRSSLQSVLKTSACNMSPHVASSTDGQRTVHNVATFTVRQYTRLYEGTQLYLNTYFRLG
jgi:hypothetical protein